MKTESEILFECFCQTANIPFKQIRAESAIGQRTPDYELQLGNLDILAEVKQIDPHRKEQEMRLYEPGSRLRKKISDANSQLKSKVKPG